MFASLLNLIEKIALNFFIISNHQCPYIHDVDANVKYILNEFIIRRGIKFQVKLYSKAIEFKFKNIHSNLN